MQQVGITVNYAPVLDMGDTVWGCRSISEDVDTVIEFGTAYVSYMEQNGIHTAVKHYPGATLMMTRIWSRLIMWCRATTCERSMMLLLAQILPW